MKAVLFDMDGTLVDSEKLWDVSLAALYERLGGELTPAVRASMVGSVAENTMRIVYTDLDLELDPTAMAASSSWLNDYTETLFDSGLPWCAGARELLDALAAERTPMALVTNTQRALTERALKSIGGHYFSATVCGDEVASGKPAPGSVPTCRGVAGIGAGAVPCRRRLGHRIRSGRARRMPGVGGAQRRRGARRQTEAAHFFAGGCRCRRPARHSFPTDHAVRRTHRLTSASVFECDFHHAMLRKGIT